MIAFLVMAQLAPTPVEPKPIATTISAIVANPPKFNGKIVRIHGWVNSCQGMSCPISERQVNAADGPGASLSIADDKKVDDVIRPLVPTYVEFDAQVNSTCLVDRSCPTRTPILTIVSLRGVVSPEPPQFEN